MLERQKRSIISKAMRDSDRFVVRVKYVDSKFHLTERVISPIRWQDETHLVAMCLGREEPRTFLLDGIVGAELVDANSVLMPEPIKGDSGERKSDQSV